MRPLRLWMLWGAALGHGSAETLCQHAFLLEPGAKALRVTDILRCENADAGGPLVYVPRIAVDGVEATVEGPGRSGLRLRLGKTAEADVYTLSSPAKPGVTMFQVRYSLPASNTFTAKVFGATAVRLVSNRAVTLSGTNVRFVGEEPQSQAHLYELLNAVPGEPFEVSMNGSLEEQAAEEQPTRGPARIFKRLSLLLALTVSLLCVGGARLYRLA